MSTLGHVNIATITCSVTGETPVLSNLVGGLEEEKNIRAVSHVNTATIAHPVSTLTHRPPSLEGTLSH
eukprot:10888959-Lingulodinium_polyedra.AAC.1